MHILAALEVGIEANLPSPPPEQNDTLKKMLHSNGSNEASAVPVVTAEPLTHHRTPTLTTCPSCGAEVVSNVSYKNGLCVWLSCVGCAAVGGILGCCLIPFHITSFKDVDHTCPSCSYRLGVCKAL
ncbi:unnamed protein product [Hymenolepis diminuta]|uniref:LITAF domain-containing protein n=1 Tax=Hymenolepis diminuta TaxID=6216 RepID=A0A0R3SSY3_HYMDI|nr:unnamed protein product [Hymenolepis diminuta]